MSLHSHHRVLEYWYHEALLMIDEHFFEAEVDALSYAFNRNLTTGRHIKVHDFEGQLLSEYGAYDLPSYA
jgi:hypothetical protein